MRSVRAGSSHLDRLPSYLNDITSYSGRVVDMLGYMNGIVSGQVAGTEHTRIQQVRFSIGCLIRPRFWVGMSTLLRPTFALSQMYAVTISIFVVGDPYQGEPRNGGTLFTRRAGASDDMDTQETEVKMTT